MSSIFIQSRVIYRIKHSIKGLQSIACESSALEMASAVDQNTNNPDDVDSDKEPYYDLHRMRAWDWQYAKKKKIAKINGKFKEAPFYYAIIAPTSFRPSSDFVVKSSLFGGTSGDDLTEPITVRAAIIDVKEPKGPNFYRAQDTTTMRLNSTETITIPAREFPSPRADYNLVVEAVQGTKFLYETSLNVQTKCVAILFQTDKGIYRPGESVKFRVFVLGPDLRPAASEDYVPNVAVYVSIKRKKQE